MAKLALWLREHYKKQGRTKKILLASVDFYRPAAIDQLEILAKQIQIDFYRSPYTKPVQAAADIKKMARTNGYEIVLLDTAGRMHIDSAMLAELKEIDTEVNPTYKLLVLDAMTGQESLTIAQAFEQALGFQGAILTKMDSGTRGGAAISFRSSLQKPILFMGTGEKTGDLELFHGERLAKRILGMGDIESLLERAEEKISQDEQQRLQQAMLSGTMTLVDFGKQMEMVGRMGSLSKIAEYMPGMGGMKLTPELIEKGEKEIKVFKAVLNSMTPKERLQPKILNGSRKQRIATGAGVKVVEVNSLLERFEQSQQFAKLLKRFGRF